MGLIVKSGNTQGLRQTGASYSTDKEVKDLSEKSAGTRVFEDTLRILFKRDVQEELAFLVDDPEINGSNIDRYKMQNPLPDGLTPSLSRTVILFDLANQDLIGKALVVQPASDRIPNESDTRYKYWAPSLFGWHPANDIFPTPKPPLPRLIYPPSVHQFAYLVSYGRTDDWVQKNPDRAIREILRKGHSPRATYCGSSLRNRPCGSWQQGAQGEVDIKRALSLLEPRFQARRFPASLPRGAEKTTSRAMILRLQLRSKSLPAIANCSSY